MGSSINSSNALVFKVMLFEWDHINLVCSSQKVINFATIQHRKKLSRGGERCFWINSCVVRLWLFLKHYINKITIFPRLPWYLLQAPQPSSSTTRTRRAPEHFEGGETVKASKKSNNTTAPASKSFEKTLFSNWKSIIDV